MENAMELWGYQEIVTPTFEHLELFTIKSGEGVLEEIYSFQDKGGREMALRPELTAPVMRMYVNELQNAPKPLRLYYFGNCFRYERPQRGRFREFWQLGAELIGGRKSDSEAEVIALADYVLHEVGVSGEIHIGYLGLMRSLLSRIPANQRPEIMRMIDKKQRGPLEEKLQELGAEHLGILDLINLKGRQALDKATELAQDLRSENIAEPGPAISGKPGLPKQMEKDAGQRSAMAGREVEAELGLEEFAETVDLLEAYEVDFTIDFEIVRGLEYYTGTVFEIYASGLGAQSQICGGGTYQLASLFGGAEVSSTGFGLGFDRIMEVVGLGQPPKAPVVIAFTPDVRKEALRLAKQLRQKMPVVVDVMGRSLGAQLKAAGNIGAEHVVIVGKDELEAGLLTLRDMKKGEQESLRLEEIEERLVQKYQTEAN
jgi:histidyl-tRNA synthetase